MVAQHILALMKIALFISVAIVLFLTGCTCEQRVRSGFGDGCPSKKSVTAQNETDAELDKQAAVEFEAIQSIKAQRRAGNTTIIFPLGDEFENLKTEIDALAFLKPGWNGDAKFPAAVINAATREAAKKLVPLLHLWAKTGWKVGPGLDGSILFSAKNIVISIGSTMKVG